MVQPEGISKPSVAGSSGVSVITTVPTPAIGSGMSAPAVASGDLSCGKAVKLTTPDLWIIGSSCLNLLGKHSDTESGRQIEQFRHLLRVFELQRHMSAAPSNFMIWRYLLVLGSATKPCGKAKWIVGQGGSPLWHFCHFNLSDHCPCEWRFLGPTIYHALHGHLAIC